MKTSYLLAGAAVLVIMVAALFVPEKPTVDKITKIPVKAYVTDETTVVNGVSNFKKEEDVLATSSKKVVKQITITPDNAVALIGQVGADASEIAMAITEKAKYNKAVYLLINSPGGSVLDGILVVSAIQASPVPVYTVCLQLCASMAAIIHQYGTQRLMVDRSILMFHEAAGGLQGSFNQMKTRLQFFDRIVGKIDYEIAKRAGQDPAAFKARLANEVWLDAEDSVQQHFADGLVNINLKGFNGSSQDAASNSVRKAIIDSQTQTLDKKVNVHIQ